MRTTAAQDAKDARRKDTLIIALALWGDLLLLGAVLFVVLA